MERYLFVVNDRPYCAWDWDLRGKNRRFLSGIDPDFFEHTALLSRPEEDGSYTQLNALSLRLAYSHALETFFAFACAAFQAPQFPLGWLLRYRPGDVPKAVRKISYGAGLLSRLSGPATWPGLASAVVAPADDLSPEQKESIALQLGQLWARFAGDFLDEAFLAEYNAMKHGMRVRPGGFVLRLGVEPSYSVAPPDSEMTTVGASEYGTASFKVDAPIGGAIDFCPRRVFRNWHPTNFFRGLDLLSMSLRNLLAYLQAQAGEAPTTIRFRWLPDPNDYTSPWALGVGAHSFEMDRTVTASDIHQTTKEEVLASYR